MAEEKPSIYIHHLNKRKSVVSNVEIQLWNALLSKLVLICCLLFTLVPVQEINAQELAKQEAIRKISKMEARITALARAPFPSQAEVFELRKEIVTLQELVFGKNSPEALEGLVRLARVAPTGEDMKFANQLLDRRIEKFGEDSYEAFLGMLQVTALKLDKKEFEVVEAEFEQLIKEKKKKYGKRHNQVALLLDSLATSYWYHYLYGQPRYRTDIYFPRAITYLERSLEIREKNDDTPKIELYRNVKRLYDLHKQLSWENSNKREHESHKHVQKYALWHESLKSRYGNPSLRPVSQMEFVTKEQVSEPGSETSNSPIWIAQSTFSGELYRPMFSWEPQFIEMAEEARLRGMNFHFGDWAKAYMQRRRANRDYDQTVFAQAIQEAEKNNLPTSLNILFRTALIYEDKSDLAKAASVYDLAAQYIQEHGDGLMDGLQANICNAQARLFLAISREEDAALCLEDLFTYLEREKLESGGIDRLRGLREANANKAAIDLSQGSFETAELYAKRSVAAGILLNQDHIRWDERFASRIPEYKRVDGYPIDKTAPGYDAELDTLARIWPQLKIPFRPDTLVYYRRIRGYNTIDFSAFLDDAIEHMEPLAETIAALPGVLKQLYDRNQDFVSMRVVVSLNGLASVYLATARPEEAEKLLRTALDIVDIAYKNAGIISRSIIIDWLSEKYIPSSFIGTLYHNLALSYIDQDLLEEAEEALIEAVNLRRRSLGTRHVDYFRSRAALVLVQLLLGKTEEARDNLYAGNVKEIDMLYPVLVYGSEKQQQSILQSQKSILHLHLSVASAFGGGEDVSEVAYSEYLKRKGMRFNIAGLRLAMQKSAVDAGSQQLFKESGYLARRISALTLSENSNSDSLESLKAQLEQNNRQLAQLSGSFIEGQLFETPDLSDISEALAEDQVLVEFVKFFALNKTARTNITERYGAFVIRPGKEIAFHQLGDADEIDYMVEDYYEEISTMSEDMAYLQSVRNIYNTKEERRISELPLNTLASRLHKRLIEPLNLNLPEEGRLYIAPDGLLHLLSFDTLSDAPGSYLIDRYTISYVATGSELVRPVEQPEANTLVIVADPDYDLDIATGANTDDKNRNNSIFNFSRLQGTALEAMRITEVLNMPEYQMLLGEEARESNLLAVESPTRLHIATHGFFQGDFTHTDVQTKLSPLTLTGIPGVPGQNYMDPNTALLQSGLALAGANQSRSVSGEEEDGILTAYEAINLDLRETDLVVLSACETGLGAIENSEGVFGLNRSFQIAGASNVVMSLWNVADNATSEFMALFYHNMKEGPHLGVASALRKAAREMKSQDEYSSPYFWGPFVLSGKK